MEIKLAELLKKELAEKSLRELSAELDIPKSVLSDWKNERMPSFKNIHHLKSLANYLGISLEGLLVGGVDGDKKIISTISFEDEGRKYRVLIERLK